MELKKLSDDQLVASTEQQFAIERKTSHYILLHLKEISVRRVYSKRGFPNLRDMLIKHFRQSETAANQRLKSLELMLAVPVVEERLVSGDLNMSTIAMAQRQILLEEKLTGNKVSIDKKAEIVESITNKAMAKAEIELFKLLPETATHPQTYERRVSEDATRLNFTMPNDVMEMMIRLKEIWAHVDPRMDPVEVIRRSFKITLQKVDPSLAKPSSKKRKLDLHDGAKEHLNSKGKEKSKVNPKSKSDSNLEAKVSIHETKTVINDNFDSTERVQVTSTSNDVDKKTDSNPHKSTQSEPIRLNIAARRGQLTTAKRQIERFGRERIVSANSPMRRPVEDARRDLVYRENMSFHSRWVDQMISRTCSCFASLTINCARGKCSEIRRSTRINQRDNESDCHSNMHSTRARGRSG